MPPRSEEDEGGGWEGVGGGGGGSRQVQITSLHSFGTGGDFFPAGLRGPGLSWAARLPTSISCSLLGSVSLSLPAPSPRSSPPPRPAGPLLGLLLYLEQHLLAAPGDHAGSRPLLEPGSRGWSHGQAGRSGRLYFYPEHPQGQLLLRAALDFSPLLAAREFREGGEVGGGGGGEALIGECSWQSLNPALGGRASKRSQCQGPGRGPEGRLRGGQRRAGSATAPPALSLFRSLSWVLPGPAGSCASTVARCHRVFHLVRAA